MYFTIILYHVFNTLFYSFKARSESCDIISFEVKMMKSSNLELFTSFAKIGAFTFGGGYAMVPVIEEEVSRKKNWINE